MVLPDHPWVLLLPRWRGPQPVSDPETLCGGVRHLQSLPGGQIKMVTADLHHKSTQSHSIPLMSMSMLNYAYEHVVKLCWDWSLATPKTSSFWVWEGEERTQYFIIEWDLLLWCFQHYYWWFVLILFLGCALFWKLTLQWRVTNWFTEYRWSFILFLELSWMPKLWIMALSSLPKAFEGHKMSFPVFLKKQKWQFKGLSEASKDPPVVLISGWLTSGSVQVGGPTLSHIYGYEGSTCNLNSTWDFSKPCQQLTKQSSAIRTQNSRAYSEADLVHKALAAPESPTQSIRLPWSKRIVNCTLIHQGDNSSFPWPVSLSLSSTFFILVSRNSVLL